MLVNLAALLCLSTFDLKMNVILVHDYHNLRAYLYSTVYGFHIQTYVIIQLSNDCIFIENVNMSTEKVVVIAYISMRF